MDSLLAEMEQERLERLIEDYEHTAATLPPGDIYGVACRKAALMLRNVKAATEAGGR